jgi:hypothetical protein
MQDCVELPIYRTLGSNAQSHKHSAVRLILGQISLVNILKTYICEGTYICEFYL